MPHANERFSVYVIDLDKKVLESAAFRRANPDYVDGKPCVYVGMTGILPIVRLVQHRSGYKSNRFARAHGLRLRRKQMRRNPMTYGEAVAWEKELARQLRKRGYGVWQN